MLWSVCVSYPFQKAHVMKLRAGVRQALQCMGKVIVCCKVEGICMKHIVDHRQEGLVVLHLQQTDPASEMRDKTTYRRMLEG